MIVAVRGGKKLFVDADTFIGALWAILSNEQREHILDHIGNAAQHFPAVVISNDKIMPSPENGGRMNIIP